MNRLELDRAIASGAKLRYHTWTDNEWVKRNKTWETQGDFHKGWKPLFDGCEEGWSLWEEPIPEPTPLDMESAVKVFAAGEHIHSLMYRTDGNRYLGDGASITFGLTEKWRIVPPPPPKQLSFEDASQMPGTWELASLSRMTMVVDIAKHITFYDGGIRSTRTFNYRRFAPSALYVKVEENE